MVSASNAALESFRGYAPLRRYLWGTPQLTWIAVAMTAVAAAAIIALELRTWRSHSSAKLAAGA